mmetsp:Transcript_1348/g.3508  ORF Transcript_1348/g.3508 Transcript_1348/m.3508 type:complete len:347 (-) Transcript_1348:36-1076(-)
MATDEEQQLAAQFRIDPADQALVGPQGAWAAASTCDGRIFLWPCDHDSDEPPCCSAALAHSGPATGFTMDWDRMWSISCGGADMLVAVVDHVAQRKMARIKDDEPMNLKERNYTCIDGSFQAGQYAVGLTDGVIKIGDLEVGKLVDKVRAHRPRPRDLNKADIQGIKADWDLKQIVSCAWDRCVSICDTRSNKWVRSLSLKGHGDTVEQVDVDFQSQQALTVGTEHKFIHWDLASGKAIKELPGPGRIAYDVSVDWRTMRAATAHDCGTVRIWDLDSNVMTSSLDCGGCDEQIQVLDVDWERQWLLTGSWENKTRLIDLKTGRCLKDFQEFATRPNTCVALKKDSR